MAKPQNLQFFRRSNMVIIRMSQPPHIHGLTLYPWLMPLMNCWGGGFQVKRMVVELIATTSTSCGGAVGTEHRYTDKISSSTTGNANWDVKKKAHLIFQQSLIINISYSSIVEHVVSCSDLFLIRNICLCCSS